VEYEINLLEVTMLAVVSTGKLVEVDTEAGTLDLVWTEYYTGMRRGHTFSFSPELNVVWEDLIGREVDVVTIDDEVIRITACDEETEN